MPMSNDPSSTLHSVDNVSSDDLAPPMVSLRMKTMLRKKREGPEGVPQLSARKMWTFCVWPDMKYVGPGWGDWFHAGIDLSCW